MLEALPPRPLNDDEVAEIEESVAKFEDVYRRNGCISFIVGTEDGYVGYQYNMFDREWVESLVEENTEDMTWDEIILEHERAVDGVIEELYELDMRKGNEFPYMP